jgi:hypothetical protein
MPSVTLMPREYRRDLPPVCAKCGVPATDAVPRLLRIPPDQWVGAWALPVLASLILCPPLYFLIAVLIGERVVVRVPTCAGHRNDWVWRDWATWWVLYPAWSVAAMGLAALAARDHGWLCFYFATAIVVVLAVVGTEFYVIGHGAVLVIGGERLEVKLRRVHPAFVEAIDQWREQERREGPARFVTYGDERDDYDDEPHAGRAPPPVRPTDDWDGKSDERTKWRRE